jgi:hypothetical protein
MDFSFGMYLLLFSAHLIQVSLGLAICSSIFMKSRKRGYACFSILGILFIYQIYKGFGVSSIMGIGMLIIILSMHVITYVVIQHKKDKEVFS